MTYFLYLFLVPQNGEQDMGIAFIFCHNYIFFIG